MRSAPIPGHRLIRALLASFSLAAILLIAMPLTAHAEQTFGIVSDTHVGIEKDSLGIDASAELAEALETLDAELEGTNAQAVFNLGDVTNYGNVEDDIDEYLQIIEEYGSADEIPYYHALGNHDLNNYARYASADTTFNARVRILDESLSLFKGKLTAGSGSVNRFLEYDNVDFIIIGDDEAGSDSITLDSISSSASIPGDRLSEETLDFLNDSLETAVRSGKMAIVLSHYPHNLSKYFSSNDRKYLKSILMSYPNTYLLSGHRHDYAEKGYAEYITYSTSDITVKQTLYNNRTGFDASKKYALNTFNVDSTYRYTSQSSAEDLSDIKCYLLEDTDDGSVTMHTYNVTQDTESTRTFTLQTGSITIKNTSNIKVAPRKKATYKITFSDGGTYAATKSTGTKLRIESGSTVKLKTGNTLTIDDVPAGVLVTIKQTEAKSNYKKASSKKLEVYANGTRSASMQQTWTPGRYTIKYCKGAKGKKSYTKRMPRGAKAEVADNTFTKKGYKFVGWNTKADGSGKSYAPGQKVKNLAAKNKTVKLYAQWKKVS